MVDSVTAGAVPLDSEAYVHRAFEDDCFSQLTANNWVLVLGPRQHGKTSGLYRLRARLEDSGIRTAMIDFQAFGAPPDYASLLRWVATRTASAFGTEFIAAPPGGEDDLDACLASTQPEGEGSLAVIIDEAGAVPTEWQNRFFSQLRALFNTRAGAEPGSFPRRTVFLFAGTFRPESLVNADNSPFNVSQDVQSDDLTADQIGELATLIGGEEFLPWAAPTYDLVGGQPYLAQVLLGSVAEGKDHDERQVLFDQAVSDLRQGKDRHFAALFGKVLAEPRLTELLGSIAASNEGIPFNAGDSDQSYLIVLGAAGVVVEGRLVMRNALYRELVTNNPQFSPGEETHDSDQVLVVPAGPSFGVVQNEDLRQFAEENFRAAIVAHNGGNHRLALAGFGSVLEALLLDHLSGLEESDLNAALSAAKFGKNAPTGSPTDWKFWQIMKVADQTELLRSTNLGPADALRDWRNLIHPAKAIEDLKVDSALRPEARMGAEVIHAILRDLSPHEESSGHS